VEHWNLSQFLEAIGGAMQSDSNAGRWLALTNYSFDISILEILWTLTKGFRTVIADAQDLIEAGKRQVHRKRLGDVLIGQCDAITHLQCTPSMGKLLISDQETRSLLLGTEKLLLGGEALPASLLKELQPFNQSRIYNMYGPTETTIWSTVCELSGETGKDLVSIGKPFGSNEVFVMDARGQLVPVGVTGELYIGGKQVTRGYLNQPELTSDKFIPNPHGGVEGGRSVCTAQEIW
jgi:non-ribosomal peptide synthetase component F